VGIHEAISIYDFIFNVMFFILAIFRNWLAILFVSF